MSIATYIQSLHWGLPEATNVIDSRMGLLLMTSVDGMTGIVKATHSTVQLRDRMPLWWSYWQNIIP
jgi:hypothetical protein